MVFLSSAICTLASGGTEARNACGSTTSRMAAAKGRPIARAASAWPSGTALTPDRRASQTKQEVYRVSATTPTAKYWVKSNCPMWTSIQVKRMSILGAAIEKNRNTTSSGVLRTTVT